MLFILRTAIRNVKKHFETSDILTVTRFLDHCTAKNEDIALKFGCVLFVCSSTTHSSFLDNSQILGVIGISFLKKKQNLLLGDQNRKISKTEITIL